MACVSVCLCDIVFRVIFGLAGYEVLGAVVFGCHPEHGGVFVTEVCILIALYLYRALLIAVKYGYMPLCEFTVITSGEYKDCQAVQMRQQLITGWVAPSVELLHEELAFAAARHRIDLGGHSIKIRKYVSFLLCIDECRRILPAPGPTLMCTSLLAVPRAIASGYVNFCDWMRRSLPQSWRRRAILTTCTLTHCSSVVWWQRITLGPTGEGRKSGSWRSSLSRQFSKPSRCAGYGSRDASI